MIEGIYSDYGTASNPGLDIAKALQQEKTNRQSAESSETTQESRQKAEPPNSTVQTDDQLTDEEKKQVEELKQADRKIRQHEMAHLSAAAGLAVSGPNYEFKRGPDGVMYAVGGEVNIDTSDVRDNPEATREKAKKIQRAAMAPSDPSPQDRKVAAQARAMESKASAEVIKEKQETAKTAAGTPETPGNAGIQQYEKTQGAIPQTNESSNRREPSRPFPTLNIFA